MRRAGKDHRRHGPAKGGCFELTTRLPRWGHSVHPDVIPALLAAAPPSPGLRHLQRQLETVVQRVLREHLVTERFVALDAARALNWLVHVRGDERAIGFKPTHANATKVAP